MDELLASALRLATPLLFAAMGGLIAERSGVATICLEGVLIASAWIAAFVNLGMGDPWTATVAAALAGTAFMAIHALLTVSLKADAIVSGVAVNLIAAGITPLLNKALYGSPTNTPSIPMEDRFGVWRFPGLADIPFVGPLLFSHKPLIYLALALPFVIAVALTRTRAGLRLMAAGDGPHALRSAGIDPAQVRWTALLTAGAVASLGGTYLAISHSSQFTRDMTAGRGFIALAAVIFGKWRPIPTLLACLFFGLADAVQIRLQGIETEGWAIPVQLVQALPYAVTLLVLVGFVGHARPPLAIGGKD